MSERVLKDFLSESSNVEIYTTALDWRKEYGRRKIVPDFFFLLLFSFFPDLFFSCHFTLFSQCNSYYMDVEVDTFIYVCDAFCFSLISTEEQKNSAKKRRKKVNKRKLLNIHIHDAHQCKDKGLFIFNVEKWYFVSMYSNMLFGNIWKF